MNFWLKINEEYSKGCVMKLILFGVLMMCLGSVHASNTLGQGNLALVSFVNDEQIEQTFVTQRGYPHMVVNDTTALKIVNPSIGRIKVVVSVNGVDPASGRRAVRATQGYVVRGGEEIIIETGRHSPKSQEGKLFAGVSDTGSINIAVFEERRDYPLLVGGKAPPREQDDFVRHNGVLHWIPPNDYPFRPHSEQLEPKILLHMTYSHE